MDTIMNRRNTAPIATNHREKIEKGVNDMLTNPTEAYNINNAYLMMIAQNMDNWRLIKTYGINGKRNCPDYYNQLCIILECLLDLLIDIKPEAQTIYENQVTAFATTINKLFISGANQTTYFDKDSADKLQRDMNHCFRDIIQGLDVGGQLRKKTKDPRLAMGDIE